jgi:magnesium-transporting ATPase (P-type)
VVKTGMNSKMGEIARLMELDEDEGTPLQLKLRQLGKFV